MPAEPPKKRELGVVEMSDATTPAHGIATPPYVERKVAEAKVQVIAEAEAAAEAATLGAMVKAKVSSWIGAGVLSAITLAGVAVAYDKLEDKAGDAGTKAAQVQVAEVAKTIAVIDAGQKGLEARMTVIEQQRQADRSESNARLERIERNANDDHVLTLGTSQKVDRLLERFNVPNPAPAPKKDGGR
jgi:hypothetical protein